MKFFRLAIIQRESLRRFSRCGGKMTAASFSMDSIMGNILWSKVQNKNSLFFKLDHPKKGWKLRLCGTETSIALVSSKQFQIEQVKLKIKLQNLALHRAFVMDYFQSPFFSKKTNYADILVRVGFKLWISGMGRYRGANCAITTTQI